ncbi:M24 family metallopeptidase [Carnobacterium gallinarum]|uniref:M24 family metallopeptidase n=1 Tax=Carnobacterium gallinarum TaxID=2749 RepID=UPI000555BBA7|nr:aminopeptidase P family protein [Carnobacterium gallinarum]
MKRLTELRKRMKEQDLDGFLVSDKTNRIYLSNFTGSSAVFLITQTKAYIITDFRYFQQLKEQAPDFEVVDHKGQMYQRTVELVQQLKLKQVGYEAEYLITKDYFQLLNGGVRLQETEHLVEALRMIKEPNEIKIMQQAAALTDEVFSYFLKIVEPGMTEQATAAKIDSYLRELGATGSAFETIVASGWRSALPHGHASEKVIQKNELITLDFGVIYQNYYSDMTRTIALGAVDSELKQIYQIVNAAGEKGLAAVEIGKTCQEVDAVCREFIHEAGYGAYFGHGTGHGIGLSCHEFPALNQTTNLPLQPQMVFTIEPGIYLPEKGGVRIEDDIWLQPNGIATSLTKSTREWIEL